MKVTISKTKTLEDYRGIIGEEDISNIRELARSLKGYSITHVNSTFFGGGVAEILHSMFP